MMKILLVDDHRMFREGLRGLLEQRGFFVSEACDGREAVQLIEATAFDVVLMDLCMPELNGVEATRRALSNDPHLKVIGLSMNVDVRYANAMFEAGAMGYVSKSSGVDSLLCAIESVCSGHLYTTPDLRGRVAPFTDGQRALTSARRTPEFAAIRPLSTRELEVLQLLAEGKSSKEIASTLDIAMPTVETHRRQIAEKLGVRSIAELTKYAIRVGLTSVD
jgi:DNA-binding NarL/FixJ family response regulator